VSILSILLFCFTIAAEAEGVQHSPPTHAVPTRNIDLYCIPHIAVWQGLFVKKSSFLTKILTFARIKGENNKVFTQFDLKISRIVKYMQTKNSKPAQIRPACRK